MDTVSAADFGAIGDGRLDDAPSIQQALDSGAPHVIIPPGEYRIGDTLLIGDDTTLEAADGARLVFADGAGRNCRSFLVSNRNPGNGNHHITLTGGVWDGNNEGNPRGQDGDPLGFTGTAINFVNVRHLAVRGLTVRNAEAFSIRVGEVEHFAVEDITLDNPVLRPNQDGIHIGGFSHHGVVRRIRGVTPDTPNDDMVALNSDDDVDRVLNLGMRRGPIEDIEVAELEAPNAYTFVRLLSVDKPIRRVTIKGIRGGVRHFAINLNNWRFPPGVGNIEDIEIADIDVAKTLLRSSCPALITFRLGVRRLTVRNLRPRPGIQGAETIRVDNGLHNRVVHDGVTHECPADQPFVIADGDVECLTVNP